MTYDGFSTVNNGSYGGIDIYDHTVFATDMSTGSGGEAKGVVAFDTATSQAQRFAMEADPIDIAIGGDGLLYILSPGGSPDGRTIYVYDPVSLSPVETIDLTAIFGWTEHRAIAIDKNGDIYIADWDGEIHHVNANGELVATMIPTCDWSGSPTACQFTDINLSASGEIALGTRFGEVILTDTNFFNVSKLNVGTTNTFVAFASDAVIPNSPPTLVIESPADDATFTEDEVIAFAATAADAEDGDLGANIQWTSNLQGALGVGPTLNTQLIPGQHTITALVTDSQSAEAADSIAVSVTLSNVIEYCSASGKNVSYEWIQSITVAGQTYPSWANGGYADFTGTTPIQLSSINAITLVPGFNYHSYYEYWRIWIDLDQNGSFDPNEQLFNGYSNAAVNGTLTIPAGTLPGLTKMRIAMKYGSAPVPCGTFTYGEIEDYTVNIAE